MPSPISFNDFKRKFEHFGVSVTKSRKKGTHIKMRKVLPEGTITWTAATDGHRVDYCYVVKGRRKFRLLPENGVTDEEFDKAR